MHASISGFRQNTNRLVLCAFVLIVLVILTPKLTQAQESSVTHVVKPGESLSSIAAQYGTTVSAVSRANGISNPNFLTIGQVLTIPVSPSPQATAEPQKTVVAPALATPVPATTDGGTPAPQATATRSGTGRITLAPYTPSRAPLTSEVVHTVYPGETLYSLAARYGTTVTAIRERNGLRTTILLVGQRIIIPASGGSGSAAPTRPLYRPAAGTPEATPTSAGSTLPMFLPTVESTARPGR